MYYLFTDASQNYLNSNYTVLAGVILDASWTPVVEFTVKSSESHNFEKAAMLHGLQLARSMNIKELRCFSDCLSTVRSSESSLPKDLLDYFKTLTINYIPRRYNLYANALSRVPANVEVRLDGDVYKAFEGVNRAKRYFFQFCEDGFFNQKQYEYSAIYNSAYSKFLNIIRELEHISVQKREIAPLRLKSLFNLLCRLFTEYRFEDANNLHEVLGRTKINKDLYMALTI